MIILPCKHLGNTKSLYHKSPCLHVDTHPYMYSKIDLMRLLYGNETLQILQILMGPICYERDSISRYFLHTRKHLWKELKVKAAYIHYNKQTNKKKKKKIDEKTIYAYITYIAST